MGRTACTEPQCLYKGELYLTFTAQVIVKILAISRKCTYELFLNDSRNKQRLFPYIQLTDFSF